MIGVMFWVELVEGLCCGLFAYIIHLCRDFDCPLLMQYNILLVYIYFKLYLISIKEGLSLKLR